VIIFFSPQSSQGTQRIYHQILNIVHFVYILLQKWYLKKIGLITNIHFFSDRQDFKSSYSMIT
jgi:hypothetical protein